MRRAASSVPRTDTVLPIIGLGPRVDADAQRVAASFDVALESLAAYLARAVAMPTAQLMPNP